MKFIAKLAVLAAAVVFVIGCGGRNGSTDAGGPGTDSGGGGGPPDSLDMRITTLNVQTPTTLGIVNGILASAITGNSINILLKNRMLNAAATVTVADGVPGATAGEFAFPACDTAAMLCNDGITVCTGDPDCGVPAMFTATLDPVYGNLMTTSQQTVVLNIGVDTNGDMMNDLLIPLNLVNASFDVYFDAGYTAIEEMNANGTSTLAGALTVQDACAINVDLGGGTTLNVLDILDGSGMGTLAPTLGCDLAAGFCPDGTTACTSNADCPACAAGTGAMNVQPDTDTNGDGTNDAYLVTSRVAADTVIITN
jgi:hypothetical protein